MAEDNSSNNNGILWFLAGLGVGAALGVLYAPKSGKETRAALRNAAEQGREAVVEGAQNLREKAGDIYSRSKEAVEQQREQLRAAYEAGKQAYQEAAAKPPVNEEPQA